MLTDNSDLSQRQLQQPISDGDLVPPLELVIKIKLVTIWMLFMYASFVEFYNKFRWKLAEIDCNKTGTHSSIIIANVHCTIIMACT